VVGAAGHVTGEGQASTLLPPHFLPASKHLVHFLCFAFISLSQKWEKFWDSRCVLYEKKHYLLKAPKLKDFESTGSDICCSVSCRCFAKAADVICSKIRLPPKQVQQILSLSQAY